MSTQNNLGNWILMVLTLDKKVKIPFCMINHACCSINLQLLQSCCHVFLLPLTMYCSPDEVYRDRTHFDAERSVLLQGVYFIVCSIRVVGNYFMSGVVAVHQTILITVS